jgi:hypothetical protein
LRGGESSAGEKAGGEKLIRRTDYPASKCM